MKKLKKIFVLIIYLTCFISAVGVTNNGKDLILAWHHWAEITRSITFIILSIIILTNKE